MRIYWVVVVVGMVKLVMGSHAQEEIAFGAPNLLLLHVGCSCASG